MQNYEIYEKIAQWEIWVQVPSRMGRTQENQENIIESKVIKFNFLYFNSLLISDRTLVMNLKSQN